MHKAIPIIFKYEWKNFLRNRFQLLLLGITLLFGLYAIYYGNAEIGQQRKTIAAVSQIEEEEFHQYQVSFQQEVTSVKNEQQYDVAADPAYAWHRHGYHAILKPTDFAPLAIGQRDLNPFYYRLTGMSLYYQLFQNEIANPLKLVAGNFDLAFVLVYLFPLLIIALTYGLLSAEKERGIFPLLNIQAISLRSILLIRLLFYFALLTGLAWVLSLTGFVFSGISLTQNGFLEMVLWLFITTAYAAFWFSLLFLIISFNKSSAFNAIVAAGGWLLFLIVVPAILNLIITTTFPVDNTSLAGLVRRNALENENDEQEVREVIQEYVQYRPELVPKQDTSFAPNLLAKAYAAFTQLNDLHHKKQVDTYVQQVVARDKLTQRFNILNPAFNTQHLLTSLAETDLATFLQFQASLVTFHQQIVNFYFTRLFHNRPILLSDYQEVPVYHQVEAQNKGAQLLQGVFQLLAVSAGLFVAGFILMGRKLL